REGEMIVTLNVSGNQMTHIKKKVLPTKGVCIKYFDIAPKTNYDRGDYDYILLLNDISTINNIPPLCREFKFILNTTIKQILHNTNTYATGTIVAVMTATHKSGTQFVFEIRDGLSIEEKTQ
ncbi:hypothetical protein KI387_000070, partial [Taxus chinensis]